MKPLRIISLPLTRSSLTFYSFHLAFPKPIQEGSARNLLTWASTKAADAWTGFGKAKQTSWKFKVHQYGEKLADRIEFEEMALKGIDPSDLGSQVASQPKIPLLYPPSVHSQKECLSTLQTMLSHRIPKHRSGFYRYLMIAPLTAPIAIIPIIPNLPFFYCAWRAWHHYRAYRASQYLQSLVQHDVLVPTPSHELDVIYKDYHPAEETTTSASTTPLLLTEDAIPAVVSLFSLQTEAGGNIIRAMDQVKLRE